MLGVFIQIAGRTALEELEDQTQKRLEREQANAKRKRRKNEMQSDALYHIGFGKNDLGNPPPIIALLSGDPERARSSRRAPRA